VTVTHDRAGPHLKPPTPDLTPQPSRIQCVAQVAEGFGDVVAGGLASDVHYVGDLAVAEPVVKPKVERLPASVAQRVEGLGEGVSAAGDDIVSGVHIGRGDGEGRFVDDVAFVARASPVGGLQTVENAASQRGEEIAPGVPEVGRVGGSLA